MMRLGTGMVRPCNLVVHGTNPNSMVATRNCGSSHSLAGQCGRRLKNITSSLDQLSLRTDHSPRYCLIDEDRSTRSSDKWSDLATTHYLVDNNRTSKPHNKWIEYQGIKNWEGLLDPLDDGLRTEILRYGEFVEAAYRAFDFDTSAPSYATCRYPNDSMLSQCGLGHSGYKVIKDLHATCTVQLPRWINRIPSWVSNQSSWIGYVAVCDDKAVIDRLGRRDVVIAYRGTATCLEWLENLRATLRCLPDDMAPKNCEAMVQSGFLSLYTSGNANSPSLQNAVREEIAKVLEIYGDEPLSITITGHSLGAALATLTAYDIASTFKHAPLVTVVSFGGPRVGNRNFRCQLEKSGTKVLRIVNDDDPVTKVPGFVMDEDDVGDNEPVQVAAGLPSWLQKRMEETQWVYAEVGKELRLSSRDCPYLNKGGVATCHDLKTYLHLINNFVSSTCPIRATAKRVIDRAQHKKQLMFS